MVNISAVIITYNEEKNIERCINSVRKVANDILVVDSYSTDDTKFICLNNGVRFIEHEFTTFSEQKNFAVGLAKYDHILSLDADEFLSEELIQSINQTKKFWTNEAFCMNRLSSYGGKWVKHGNWYPDKQTRLWNRRFGNWGGGNPHEKLMLQKGIKVIRLKGDLMHRSYKDAEAALLKIQLYSSLYARTNFRKEFPSVFTVLTHTCFAFFKCYILKRGFLDGYRGLAVAMAIMNHTYYKYAKLYEANQFITKPSTNLEKPVNGKITNHQVLVKI